MLRTWPSLVPVIGPSAVAVACSIEPAPTPDDPSATSGESSVSPDGVEIVASDGVWCWFADPRALVDQAALYVGWIDGEGNVMLGRRANWNHDDTRAPLETVVVHEQLQVNDHASPGLFAHGDGRISVFYSAHNGDDAFVRTTGVAADLSSLGDVRRLEVEVEGTHGFTYLSPRRVDATSSAIMLSWRGADWQPTFSWSHDDGNTWGAARTLFRSPGERPYTKVAFDGRRRTHFAFTRGHPGEVADNDVYYVAMEDGVFWGADGRLIADAEDLPLSPQHVDLVYDASQGGAPAWIWDVAGDANGDPVIVFATFAANDDHRYHYATWHDGAWQHHEVLAAGGYIDGDLQPYYSGGIALLHDDPRVMVASYELDGRFEIARLTTRSRGLTVDVDALTQRSSVDNVRPVFALGSRTALWLRGEYHGYGEYALEVVARRGL